MLQSVESLLGTYSIESGLIYFDSLLRSSLLYAAETYYNLIESDFRLIESKEEECLKKLIQTGSKCPGAMLYLEFGVLPARFKIKIMMLIFLHYILLENKQSLISRFFQAQLDNPIRGDWVINIKHILQNLDLEINFDRIREMKKSIFLKQAKKSIKYEALKYLVNKIKSKGKEIDYRNELKCQRYLQPNRILTHDKQILIFAYRSRMNNLKYNFGSEVEICVCGTRLVNEHLYICEKLSDGKLSNVPYNEIFNGSIKQQKHIVQILVRNMKKYQELTLAQEIP